MLGFLLTALAIISQKHPTTAWLMVKRIVLFMVSFGRFGSVVMEILHCTWVVSLVKAEAILAFWEGFFQTCWTWTSATLGAVCVKDGALELFVQLWGRAIGWAGSFGGLAFELLWVYRLGKVPWFWCKYPVVLLFLSLYIWICRLVIGVSKPVIFSSMRLSVSSLRWVLSLVCTAMWRAFLVRCWLTTPLWVIW